MILFALILMLGGLAGVFVCMSASLFCYNHVDRIVYCVHGWLACAAVSLIGGMLGMLLTK